jgi:hypothetical protein
MARQRTSKDLDISGTSGGEEAPLPAEVQSLPLGMVSYWRKAIGFVVETALNAIPKSVAAL